MSITPSFKKRLIVEQFQGNYLKHKRVLYYLDELYGNELVFAFSFISSNNTDVETSEQFILRHTRYVCDFSGLTNSPRNSETPAKKTLILYFVYFFGFLAFDLR